MTGILKTLGPNVMPATEQCCLRALTHLGYHLQSQVVFYFQQDFLTPQPNILNTERVPDAPNPTHALNVRLEIFLKQVAMFLRAWQPVHPLDDETTLLLEDFVGTRGKKHTGITLNVARLFLTKLS